MFDMRTTSFKLVRSETKNTFLGGYGSFQIIVVVLLRKLFM